MEQIARYLVLVTDLAQQALCRATKIQQNAKLCISPLFTDIKIGLTAAKKLLNQPVDQARLEESAAVLSRGEERYNDASGFTRSVYHPLLVRLHLLAGVTLTASALAPMRNTTDELGLELGRAAALAAAGESVEERVDRAIEQPGEDGALHRRGANEQLDAWTYQELSALHALHPLAEQFDRPDWRKRMADALDHHQRLTQPDYTTYQPWAVAAFIESGDHLMFADQQLHDAKTNLHVDQRCAAAVALILADAVHTLSNDGVK